MLIAVQAPSAIMLNLLLFFLYNSEGLAIAALLLNTIFFIVLLGFVYVRFKILHDTEGKVAILDTELEGDEKDVEKLPTIVSYP